MEGEREREREEGGEGGEITCTCLCKHQSVHNLYNQIVMCTILHIHSYYTYTYTGIVHKHFQHQFSFTHHPGGIDEHCCFIVSGVVECHTVLIRHHQKLTICACNTFIVIVDMCVKVQVTRRQFLLDNRQMIVHVHLYCLTTSHMSTCKRQCR